MSTLDALRRAVDNYPGSRESLAPRLSKTAEVLRKELSGAATHKLGAVDALAIARMCVEAKTACAHDYAAVIAAECGGRFEPGTADDAADGPLQRVSALMRETADVTSTVIDALGDGVISDNELAQIEREICQAEAVLVRLRQCARAVNRAGKPRERGVLDLPVRHMTEPAS